MENAEFMVYAHGIWQHCILDMMILYLSPGHAQEVAARQAHFVTCSTKRTGAHSWLCLKHMCYTFNPQLPRALICCV
eukprot:366775-Pelagomonas_calceolata.AAC.8